MLVRRVAAASEGERGEQNHTACGRVHAKAKACGGGERNRVCAGGV